MTVEYEVCRSCNECFSEYCYNQCCLCDEQAEYCEDCDIDYLVIFNKYPKYICDGCIPRIGEDNFFKDIEQRINEMAKDNKMFKYAVIKVLQTEHEKRTKIKNIEKLESEVEILKVAINNQYAIIGIGLLKNSS